MKSHFVVCHVTEPERDVSKLFEKPLEQIEKRINRIKAEQASLDLDVKRAWNKYQRELPEQESIHDLPLFNIEAQHTEQLSLF